MPDLTPEYLDRWAAERLMGWILAVYSFNDDRYEERWYEDSNGKGIIREEDWRPDLPKTGQIWKVIEKMRKIDGDSGFNFNLNWQGHPGIEIAIARFHKIHPFIEGHGSGKEPCLAALKAAHKAVEGK